MAGERGVKPAPTAVKKLRGDRPSRIAVNEPKPKPSLKPPAPPRDMPLEAQKVWKKLAHDLWAKGVLTQWDEESFAAFCIAVVTHARAAAIVEEEGIIVDQGHGRVKNPALQVERDQALLMLRAGAEFGLTPSSRSRIEISPEEGDDAQRLLS